MYLSNKFIEYSAKMTQEKDSWASTCRPGGKYYLTRNHSTLVAFAVGKKWQVCFLILC